MAILERPQVYRQAQQKGDPNDLITLAIQLGRYVERLEAAGTKTALVLPSAWKGQVPKDVHHRRIVAKLSPAEASRVASRLERVAESKRHNVLDAVGLAKWAAANPSFWPEPDAMLGCGPWRRRRRPRRKPEAAR